MNNFDVRNDMYFVNSIMLCGFGFGYSFFFSLNATINKTFPEQALYNGRDLCDSSRSYNYIIYCMLFLTFAKSQMMFIGTFINMTFNKIK